MIVVDPGHSYLLDNLKSEGQTVLRFMKDANIHPEGGFDGPSCQEVIRALIDRVQTLDREAPWPGNERIIYHARMMLAGF